MLTGDSATSRLSYSCRMSKLDEPSSSATNASVAPEPSKRRAPRRVSPAAAPVSSPTVKKPVNTLAIIPKSTRITSLGRKGYNVLLFEAQMQGLEKDVYRVPLERIVKGVDFGSNDHALIKKHLRAMVSTTVEWQSPTTGEGTAWNISGLLSHAKLTKERGQVWVEWSYAVNLKQELLQPTVFARLKLEIISQLRSHAGIALYEICARYKDVGRTARQTWRWWRPVLSGQPETERTARLEYRIFKRDTLKPAIAEVNTITDLEVELVEHKSGRFVDEIQFLIQPKKQASLPTATPPEPVDLSLVAKVTECGIDEDKAEDLIGEFGAAAVQSGLVALTRRIEAAYPEPLRDRYRYLRSLMPGEVALMEKKAAAVAAVEQAPVTAATVKAVQSKRQTLWNEEWLRRRRALLADEIQAMSADVQAQLTASLLADMDLRNVHPSIRRRLQVSGWQHPMVRPEMIRWYAVGAYGDGWDKPTPEDILLIATEMGDG